MLDEAYLFEQMLFSETTFGPGPRVYGVTDHMRKELDEVIELWESDKPTGPEWIDLIILAIDGAWRSGMTPKQIIAGVREKLAKNKKRKWPDWRTQPADRAIEHKREPEKTDLEKLLDMIDFVDARLLDTEELRKHVRGMILKVDGG